MEKMLLQPTMVKENDNDDIQKVWLGADGQVCCHGQWIVLNGSGNWAWGVADWWGVVQ